MDVTWSKRLKKMSIFAIKEIEKHRQLSGKAICLPISKTLVRGRKLKEEGYLKLNTMYTSVSNKYFEVKCKYQTRMKAELRSAKISLNKARETS